MWNEINNSGLCYRYSLSPLKRRYRLSQEWFFGNFCIKQISWIFLFSLALIFCCHLQSVISICISVWWQQNVWFSKKKKKKKSQNYFSHPTALLVTMTIFGLPVLINRLISSITHSHGIYVHGLNMHIYPAQSVCGVMHVGAYPFLCKKIFSTYVYIPKHYIGWSSLFLSFINMVTWSHWM